LEKEGFKLSFKKFYDREAYPLHFEYLFKPLTGISVPLTFVVLVAYIQLMMKIFIILIPLLWFRNTKHTSSHPTASFLLSLNKYVGIGSFSFHSKFMGLAPFVPYLTSLNA